MSTRLAEARREVEWLDMSEPVPDGGEWDRWHRSRWEAGHRVAELEERAASKPVTQARRAARFMDGTLVMVAAMVFVFSLGNVHAFALRSDVTDPIAWLLAPAVDLALVAALTGDAVLSRHQLTAGPWATALRWFSGLATLALNSWDAWAAKAPAAIVAHTVPPVLLILLAEAAPHYRDRFAETVRIVRAALDAEPGPAAHGPAPVRPATPRPADRPHPGRPGKDLADVDEEAGPRDSAQVTPSNPPAGPVSGPRTVAAAAPPRRPVSTAVRTLAAESTRTASEAQRDQVRAWIAGRIAAGESTLWKDVQDVVSSQWSRSRTWYLDRLAEVRQMFDEAEAELEPLADRPALHLVPAVDDVDDQDDDQAAELVDDRADELVDIDEDQADEDDEDDGSAGGAR